jgi:hypothetical protein
MEQLVMPGAHYASMLQALCPDGKRQNCSHIVPDKNVPVIADTGHLTIDGADFLFTRMEERAAPWVEFIRAQ